MAQRRGTRQIQPTRGPEKAFGQALREIRQKRKLSQEELALESGLDRSYVSLIERGIRSPTIRIVVRLANVLQVSPSHVVSRMEALLEQPKQARTTPRGGRRR